MIAVGVISIATVVLGIQFKNVKPEYGILLSITGCLIIFIMMLTKLTYIINIFNQISELTNVSKEYIKILLKITGITFICEIASEICKDCGNVAISNQVQIFGKISILVISLPIFSELILKIGKMLS